MSFVLFFSGGTGMASTYLTGNLIVPLINYQADTLVQLKNLTNGLTNTPVNTAAVTVQIIDSTGIVRYTMSLILIDMLGDYENIIPASVTSTFTLANMYDVRCTATTSDGAIFIDEQSHLVQFISS